MAKIYAPPLGLRFVSITCFSYMSYNLTSRRFEDQTLHALERLVSAAHLLLRLQTLRVSLASTMVSLIPRQPIGEGRIFFLSGTPADNTNAYIMNIHDGSCDARKRSREIHPPEGAAIDDVLHNISPNERRQCFISIYDPCSCLVLILFASYPPLFRLLPPAIPRYADPPQFEAPASWLQSLPS